MLCRLVDACDNVLAFFKRTRFRGNQSEYDALILDVIEWGKSARAVGVVFEKEAVDPAAAEENLRDGLVAARGKPCRAEIAAADVHGDRHVRGLCLQCTVDHRNVGTLDAVEIEAARLVRCTLLRITELAPGRVVELQIAAARLVESTDCLLIGKGNVIEESILVLVARNRCVVRRTHAADEVQHAGRGDCHLCDGIPCEIV